MLAAAFSPDGKKIVLGGDDGVVRLWDIESAEPPARLGDFKGPVDLIAYSRDGKLIAATTRKGELKLWDAA